MEEEGDKDEEATSNADIDGNLQSRTTKGDKIFQKKTIKTMRCKATAQRNKVFEKLDNAKTSKTRQIRVRLCRFGLTSENCVTKTELWVIESRNG